MITGILMSLNDPRWGNNNQGDGNRRGEQGPPDLEDIWRDLNRRLSGAFGRKTGGGGNGQRGDDGNSFTPKQFGGGFLLIIALVAILWLGSGFYTVDASERGVVLRFGRFSEITTQGLQWRLPYPFETHELVNVSQVRTIEVGYRGTERNQDTREALMLTDDENIINIQFAVQYTIGDPAQFLFNNRDPEDSVKQAAETAMREIVGKSKMDFVLYEGKEAVTRNAAQLMQEILNRYETGIRISNVTVRNVQPPEQVQAAFNDAVKAGQDRERLKNEGQAYANDVIPKARGAASRLMEEATGYSARVVAQAEGDSSRFKQVVTEYAKAPEVTRNRMYLDTMQQIFTNTTKVMVDSRSNGNLLYLPLDRLMQQVGGGSSQATLDPASARTMPPLNDLPATSNGGMSGVADSRDPSRARERGER